MKRFVQFMTLNNERTYIDPQTIIRFSEYKYRDNDNGYVGTRIEYTGNDSTLVTFTVKDPIDAVADALADTPKGIDIPALNERLILNKEPDPVLNENLNNFRQAMQEKGVKAAQVRADSVLIQSAQEQQKVLENLAKIIQQHDGEVVIVVETDTQEDSFNWVDYRPLERGETIYPSDKVKLGGKPYSVSTDMVGKSYSSRSDKPIFRQYMFYPGDTVQHIKPHDTPIYKVVQTIEDSAGHMYCVLEGRRRSVPVKELVLYTPTPISFWPKDLLETPPEPAPNTYRTPPQETPPCNGNGEAQSTEE